MNRAPRLTIRQVVLLVLLTHHFPASGSAGKDVGVVVGAGVDWAMVVPAVVVVFSVVTSSSLLGTCVALVVFCAWTKAAKQNKASKINTRKRN